MSFKSRDRCRRRDRRGFPAPCRRRWACRHLGRGHQPHACPRLAALDHQKTYETCLLRALGPAAAGRLLAFLGRSADTDALARAGCRRDAGSGRGNFLRVRGVVLVRRRGRSRASRKRSRSARRLRHSSLPPQPPPGHQSRPPAGRPPASVGPSAGQRESRPAPDRARPRRAAFAASPGRPVHRPSLRSAPHGQGRQAVLRRDCAGKQRLGTGDCRPDGRPRGKDAAASTGFPARWAA